MSIVDAHFHIWRAADLPWLSGPMQPRIFGPYEPIRRDYPITEYLDDIAGLGVSAAVYVQANWPSEKAEDEIAWVTSVAEETGWPQAIVGFADVTVADIRPALERIVRFPLVRGIRQQFHWHDNPQYRFAARPDLCLDAAVQRNVAHIGEAGLVFELQVFADQMAGAAALAQACPNTTFVLQHAGMLEDLSPAGIDRWREEMSLLAAHPNVVAKLSGLGTFLHRVDQGHIGFVVAETVALFGPDRCLWGSNFPIEKLWTDYAALLAAHRTAVSKLGAVAADAIFTATAQRIYRL